MNLQVKETKNINDIHAVLKRPDIFDAISCDKTPCAEHFNAPISDKYKYIAGYHNGEIIGLMVYHTYKDGNICHIQVLPEHRKEHAREFGEQALKFRGTRPLYAEIPDSYQNVLSFAKSFGFDVVEKVDQGYTKNGESHLINVLKFKGV